MAGHARQLDRRRLDLLVGRGEVSEVLAALEAYRNDDGGYGWGLEPDLRSPESQPAGALHAFEVFAEVGPVDVTASGRALRLVGDGDARRRRTAVREARHRSIRMRRVLGWSRR